MTSKVKKQASASPTVVVLVGKENSPVSMKLLNFRRAIRMAAKSAEQSQPKSDSRGRDKTKDPKTNTKCLAAVLLKLLALRIEGVSSSRKLHSVIDTNNTSLVEQGFWALVDKDQVKRHLAKLEQTCPKWNITSENIVECLLKFERVVALQVSLGLYSAQKKKQVEDSPLPRQMVRTPVPWLKTDPPLVLGREGAFFGHDTLHPIVLGNSMVVGGTGSGKTASQVMPVMKSLLCYKLANQKVASLLVIDPKRELGPEVVKILKSRNEDERLIVIGECPPVRFFEPDCPLSPSERVEKLKTFTPLEGNRGNSIHWLNLANVLIKDFVTVEVLFAVSANGNRLIFILAAQLGIPCYPGQGYWPKLREVFGFTCLSASNLKRCDELFRELCELAGLKSPSTMAMQMFATGQDEPFVQWCYTIQSGHPFLAALGNPDVEKFVDLDVVTTTDQPRTDVLSRETEGKVILFCPEKGVGGTVAVKALKQKYFEGVYARDDLERPVGVIIDEAQRFITCDDETGEHAFLDRCRAYRTLVVMASQSIASMKHALGSTAQAQTAIDIISANSPSKFIMRSTDIDTVRWLRTQLPEPPFGLPHVIEVRQPSSLVPGEAYFFLADGSWGRKCVILENLA